MLTHEQTVDLAQLQALAGQRGAEVVIIGAAALLCFVDLGRFTRDIDLAVALDLEDFETFSRELTAHGWMQEPGMEHRWRGPRGSIIDLMPAGPNLRTAKRMIWPESQFAMSLVGFEHVFTRSVLITFAPGVRFKVAPAPVVALLKIVAYLEDPHRRQKDLHDLRLLLGRYEEESDRIFCNEVFAAELEDFGCNNAFLLGVDIGTIATDDDANIVHEFLEKHQIPATEREGLAPEDHHQRDTLRFQMELRAFEKGFETSRQRETPLESPPDS
jgi:predicted nucleotidyltransferase